MGCDDGHDGNADGKACECAMTVAAAEAERQDEHTEQRSIEERSEPIHDLDERAEAGGKGGDDAGEDAPEERRRFRNAQIVLIRLRGPEVPPVHVDHGGRRERVELGGDARHRCCEYRGDDQPDEPDWQSRRDKRREHVVDVRDRRIAHQPAVTLIARHIADDRGRLAADAFQRGVCGNECFARCGTLLVGVGSRQHRRGAAPVLERLRKPRLELLELRPPAALLHALGVRSIEQHRRLIEKVEHEHEHAGEEHQCL